MFVFIFSTCTFSKWTSKFSFFKLMICTQQNILGTAVLSKKILLNAYSVIITIIIYTILLIYIFCFVFHVNCRETSRKLSVVHGNYIDIWTKITFQFQYRAVLSVTVGYPVPGPLRFSRVNNAPRTWSSTVRPRLPARLCGSCTVLTRRFSSKTNHLRRSTLISAPNSAGVAALHASLATIIDGLTFTQSDTLRRRLGAPPKSVHSSLSSPLFICKYIYIYISYPVGVTS